MSKWKTINNFKHNFLCQQRMRRALSAGMAVGISCIIAYYYSISAAFLTTLSAWLVMPASVGTPVRQSLQRGLVIIASVIVSTAALVYIHPTWIVDVLWVVFVVCFFAFTNMQNRVGMGFVSACIVSVCVLVLFQTAFNFRVYDAVIGVGVGVLVALLFLTGQAAEGFRKSIVPVLKAYTDYLVSIIDLFSQKENAEQTAQKQRLHVENVLRSQRMLFPDWVYEPGFNPQLRIGYRFFLVKVEQLGQILFAMHYTARQQIDPKLLDELLPSIEASAYECKELMATLITLLELKKVETLEIQGGIEMMEQSLKRAVPLPLELLDMSKSYINSAMMVYDLKDLYATLLKLAEAFR